MTSLPPGRGQAQVQWTPMPPRLVESAAAGMPLWRRRVEKVGAGPCLQGVCRQVLRQGGQRKRPGAVVGRFAALAPVADINPGRGRQRFAGFHHRIRAARRSAIRRAKAAPTGPLPIISTSMFSSISVLAFVVLRAHARCRCTENRYYSFVRPDKWFLDSSHCRTR